MSKKVYIKSIPRETASKIHEYVNSEGSFKRLNKTKIGNCKDAYQALYSRKEGGLCTGLSRMVEDPSTGNLIKLQTLMERKWGKPEGYFTNQVAASGYAGDKNKELSYFHTKVWKLNDGTTILDLDNMDDEIFYYVCLASSFCANSEKEWKEHRWPKASYYIALENESDEIKQSKKEKRRIAIAAMQQESMTPTAKRKIISILDLVNSNSALTENQVNNTLDDYIMNSDSPDASGKTQIDKFMELFELHKTDAGRQKFEAEYLLKTLIDNRIVFERQGTYKWVRKDMELGYRKAEAVDFLLHPKKLVEREELEAELKAKKA